MSRSSEFDIELRDGAKATIRVTCELWAGAANRDDREDELANMLGGILAGASRHGIESKLLSARSTMDTDQGGGR